MINWESIDYCPETLKVVLSSYKGRNRQLADNITYQLKKIKESDVSAIYDAGGVYFKFNHFHVGKEYLDNIITQLRNTKYTYKLDRIADLSPPSTQTDEIDEINASDAIDEYNNVDQNPDASIELDNIKIIPKYDDILDNASTSTSTPVASFLMKHTLFNVSENVGSVDTDAGHTLSTQVLLEPPKNTSLLSSPLLFDMNIFAEADILKAVKSIEHEVLDLKDCTANRKFIKARKKDKSGFNTITWDELQCIDNEIVNTFDIAPNVFCRKLNEEAIKQKLNTIIKFKNSGQKTIIHFIDDSFNSLYSLSKAFNLIKYSPQNIIDSAEKVLNYIQRPATSPSI